MTYRSINNPDRYVEAVHYLPQGENQAFVRNFLELSCRSPWSGPHTEMGGGNYQTICYQYKRGSTIYVSPDSIVYVDKDGEPGVFAPDIFHEYFIEAPEQKEPEPMPVVMLAPETYTRTDSASGDVFTAIQYSSSYNYDAVKHMLAPYGVSSSPSIYSGDFAYQPAAQHIDVRNIRHGLTSTPLNIHNGIWITIAHRNDYALPMICLYSDTVFADTFSRYTTTKTEEPTMAQTDPTPSIFPHYSEDTEYGAHRIEVLDALAILRSNPSDAHFEIAANELMAHLATAFNTGYAYGLEVGEYNPYENRA